MPLHVEEPIQHTHIKAGIRIAGVFHAHNLTNCGEKKKQKTTEHCYLRVHDKKYLHDLDHLIQIKKK